MKEKRCRVPIEDIIWKKSLCPYVLSSENISKLKVSKVHYRYSAHWGTDLTWKNENNLVVSGLLWFGRKWWAVPCWAAAQVGTVHPVPGLPWSRNREWQWSAFRIHWWELAACSTQENPTLLTLCVGSRLFSLSRTWDKTQSVLLSGFHLQSRWLNSLTLICRRCKEPVVPPSFHCRVACWLCCSLLCNRN